uniref:Uncharacterized protein n=1 Tax=viral metagenome TaxID=1070528 RepID=A0A6M3LFR2_9ZZZZ
MKWKETVMNDKAIDKLFTRYEKIDPVQETPFVMRVARKQAKVSYGAGMREVIEWCDETCPHDLFGEGTHCYKRACDMCWQEKLKEDK